MVYNSINIVLSADQAETFKINDPDFPAILKSLATGSTLSEEVEKYGFTVKQLLGLYAPHEGQVNIENFIDFEEKYKIFLENFSFSADCINEGERIEISELINIDTGYTRYRSIILREIRDFCVKISEILDAKIKAGKLLENPNELYGLSMEDLAIKWNSQGKDTSGEQSIDTELYFEDARKPQGSTESIECKLERIEFSKDYLNLNSPEEFKTSLKVLDLNMVPAFLAFMKENKKGNLGDQPNSLMNFRNKYSKISSFVAWHKCIDDHSEFMYSQIRDIQNAFIPNLLPKDSQEIVNTKEYFENLIDISSEKKYISSLLLLDYKIGHVFLKDLKIKVEGGAKTIAEMRGKGDLTNTFSNNIEGFIKTSWINFIYNWCPHIFEYLEELRLEELENNENFG